jgi:two-component sensor histidine kinase
LLTEGSWEGTTLREVVELALKPYREDGEERFKIEGPSVQLAPTTALAFALALHELTTNAIKHGALSVPGGAVRIGWEISEDNEEPRLRFTWIEHGGPAVSTPTARGFGTRMIERGLAADLSGTVQLNFAPTGLVCTIDAPLPRLAPGRE